MIARLLVRARPRSCVARRPLDARDAGTECDGLIVCIPVAGPWVQVLGGGDADVLPALRVPAAAR